MWPDLRAQQLTQQTMATFSKPVVRFAFLPSSENDFIQYFPPDFSADCQAGLPPAFQYVANEAGLEGVDVVILTAHGGNAYSAIWGLRQQCRPGTLLMVWLWDNHLRQLTNLSTALASDYVFPSHKYAAGYLATPASALGTHVPACCGQWTRSEAAAFFAQHRSTPRGDRLLVNYVDYPFSPRSQLLHRIKAEVPEAHVLLMDPNERSRYFSKSRQERFLEWMDHKSTLILPVERDLSTRVFDALLAGQILLVPDTIADFDAVIPPATQSALGILRLRDLEMATIRQAAAEAQDIYAAQGMDGVLARHRYVLDNHMIVHRLRSMLLAVKAVADRQVALDFGGNAHLPYGLHLFRQ